MSKSSVNPKDLLGIKKINTFVWPPIATMHGAHAMMDGAVKYGPYNWRDKAVIASIYIAAADRHLKLWQCKEETADDSGVHHLGHALACIAILIDAQTSGNLKDDRVYSPETIAAIHALNKAIGDKVAQRTVDEFLAAGPGISNGGGAIRK